MYSRTNKYQNAYEDKYLNAYVEKYLNAYVEKYLNAYEQGWDVYVLSYLLFYYIILE